MKKILVFCILTTFGALLAMAQDDMYFVPKKKKAAAVQPEQKPVYGGSCRDVDEYNRRGKFRSSYEGVDADSLASDVFDFEQGGYGDTLSFAENTDTYAGDDDYRYCRRMSRFDDFYWYDPWYHGWYGSYWYGNSYWGWRYGWYDPWFGPWYDPWFYGYYRPWHYGWYYPHYWYGSYYRPYYGFTGTANHGRPSYGHSAAGKSNFKGYRGQNNRNNSSGRFNNRRYENNNNDRFNNENNRFRGERRNNYGNFNTTSRPSYNSGGSFGGNRGGGSFGGSRGGGGHFGGRR